MSARMYRAFKHGRLVTAFEAKYLSFELVREMERYEKSRTPEQLRMIATFVDRYLKRLASKRKA